MAPKPPAQLDLFGAEETAPKTEPTVRPVGQDLAVIELANRVPERVRLGTSSWSFPGWAGLVYDDSPDKKRLARQGLAAYAQHPLLRTVGVDRTYYGPIDAEAFGVYAAAVPNDFRFLVKAHEYCTVARFPGHPRYGDRAGRENPYFLDPAYAEDAVIAPVVEGLGAKLGVLLFQFPPQAHDPMGGIWRFPDRLHAFLQALQGACPIAIELRDSALLVPPYAAALADSGASHCLNVHPTMPTPTEQLAATPGCHDQLVIRWMLRQQFSYEEAKASFAPFDRLVEPDPRRRSEIAGLVRQSDEPAIVIINNKAEGSAPLSALHLAEEIVTGKQA